MSDDFGFKLIGAWNAYQKAIDPAGLQTRLDRYMKQAGERIGRQFVARAQRAIRDKVYTPNSPITIILKGGQSTPLVGRGGGDLFQSITYDASNPYRILLGVLRAKASDETLNLAIILHEGATIDVGKHPNVRKAVWAKVREAMGQRATTRAAKASRTQAVAKLASGGTTAAKNLWVIPPRPFIAEPMMDPAFAAWARKEWTAALQLAIFGPKGKHTGPTS